MRNFVLIFFVFTTSLAVQSVRAESTHDMCGMNVTTDKNGETIVTCASCTTSEDYALAGAAALKNSGLNDILVQSPDEVTEFHVTLSPAYKNASATVSASVGVASGSFTNNVVDHNATTVAARKMRGSVSGGSWKTDAVSNRAIARKCTNLVRDSIEAIERSIRNTESIHSQLNWMLLNGVHVGRRGKVSSCEADDEGNCKTQGIFRYSR